MRYLGIKPKKLRVSVYDFTGCEGCELQLANHEETLVDFLNLLEIVSFREISSANGGTCDIALIDGSISRGDEINRLLEIRKKATVLVAMGSCACFGGVSRQKNALNLAEINRDVYGDNPKETMAVRAIKEIVPVDMEIPGCPVSKEEVERIVQHLVWEVPYNPPAYPVCYECKQRYTICRYEKGELCLGVLTRGGCNAPCPAGGLGCWGCRGPALDANIPEFVTMARDRGFSDTEIRQKLSFFGGFEVSL